MNSRTTTGFPCLGFQDDLDESVYSPLQLPRLDKLNVGEARFTAIILQNPNVHPKLFSS
jgi:hypothetical protein